MKSIYEVWVQVDGKGGPVAPQDGKPLETLGEAIALAKEFLPKVEWAVIVEKRVARRLRGDIEPKEKSDAEEGNGPA